MAAKAEFDFNTPLETLQSSVDKTPDHWFNEYASWVQKTPKEEIASISINSNNFESMKSKLVHFRGMISNQYNPEYFHSQFITNNYATTNKVYSGLYCDLINVPKDETIMVNDNKTKTMQRYPMLLVKPPNQTHWRQNKQQLSLTVTANQNNNNNNNDNSNSIEDEKGEDNNNNESRLAMAPEKIVAKFYSHENSLKICDLVDVYGIWYPPTNRSNDNNNNDNSNDNDGIGGKTLEKSEDDLEFDTLSNLPTIHILYWKKIENAFNDDIPLPNDNMNTLKFNETLDNLKNNVDDIRDSLIDYIATYFNNDKLVGQYVLLNMISKVVTRKHSVLIGNFSLNINGFSPLNPNVTEMVDKINKLYSMLMPYVMQIDISINNLNNDRFVPFKNHNTNELELSSKNNLQFLNNTSLIINQIPLKIGTLNEKGILNCNALSQLINKQVIEYDFEYSKINFQTDANVVVLSEKNPLKQLQCLTNVKILHCNNAIIEESNENSNNNNDNSNNDNNSGNGKPNEEALTQWRHYICVAKLLLDKFSLPENVCKLVEQDFVNLRKQRKDVTEDDLHYRLTVLRLLNASLLKQETDSGVLKLMQKLENQRFDRNNRK